ncbi:MAG: hypothetical protein H6624_05520 [Bdellovibrionaceae bacterium]|nr:hypothetical protein [Pseudobdellovibrionaceae bacterium]
MIYKKAFLKLPKSDKKGIQTYMTISILSAAVLSYFDSDMTYHQGSLGAKISTILPILVVVLYNIPEKAPSILFFLIPAFPLLQVANDLLMLILVYTHASVLKGAIKLSVDFLLILWSWRSWLEYLRVAGS